MKTDAPKRIVSRPKPDSTKDQSSNPKTSRNPSSSVLERQLGQSIQERRRLKAAEYSADDPVKTNAKRRGDLVGRRISHLQSKLENQE